MLALQEVAWEIRRKTCAKSMMRDLLAVATPDKGRDRKMKKKPEKNWG